MNPTSARQIEQAVAAMTSALRPTVEADWTVPAGGLDWSCWQTAAHVAHDLLAYAGQVTAGPREAYLPLDLVVRSDASPSQLLEVVQTAASLLVLALDSASPDARAWHFGLTDPSGFATLGVNELLVHTWDIAQGLGLRAARGAGPRASWTGSGPMPLKVLPGGCCCGAPVVWPCRGIPA